MCIVQDAYKKTKDSVKGGVDKAKDKTQVRRVPTRVEGPHLEGSNMVELKGTRGVGVDCPISILFFNTGVERCGPWQGGRAEGEGGRDARAGTPGGQRHCRGEKHMTILMLS